MRRMKMIPYVVLVAVFSACSGGGVDNATFTTRDSAGIHIAENISPTWGDGDAWHLSEAPLVDIGALEGDPTHELYRVTNSVRLPDGRIVVANSGTNQLRFYDESGGHLLDAGGEGEGPGEFSFINWVSRYRGDSIAAYDMRQMRFSVFDSAGSFARSFPFPGMDASSRGRAQGVFENGSIFALAIAGSAPDNASEGFRSEEPLYLVSPEGEFQDNLLISSGGERFIHTPSPSSTGRTMVLVGAPMFGKSTKYGILGNQFIVASNDFYEVHVHGQDGSLESIVRRRHENLEVTDADIQAMREQRLGDMPSEMQEAMIGVLDATPISETMPAYNDIIVDQLGNLWVEEFRRPGNTERQWTVFTTEGEMLGTLSVPDQFVIHDVGNDYVLGRWQDELEIEHVLMYELIKP